MDNCFNSEVAASDTQNSSKNKLRTHFAKIIVSGTTKKPYYEILYHDPTDNEYHIGFGSYCLDYVADWLANEFEIVDAVDIVDSH